MSLIALGLAFVCAVSAVVPPKPVSAATVWTKNLYSSYGFMTQDPYYSACVAASTMMMLNFIDLADTGGDGFRWTNTRVRHSSNKTNYRDMTSVQWFARSHDTLKRGPAGSDPHGWRNALNYYGWGSAAMRDKDLWVYDDRAYVTFDDAVKAAVQALAKYDKPVGILGSAGGHAQVMTGYVAVGEDPAVSTDFTVSYIYLSDPLHSRWIRNKKVSIATLRSGSTRYRFLRYYQGDSPYDDVYTTGWRRSSVAHWRGSSEWWGRFVILEPIRAGVRSGTPEPTPEPTPTPVVESTDEPAPVPTAEPTLAPAAEPTPSPDPEPTPSPA